MEPWPLLPPSVVMGTSVDSLNGLKKLLEEGLLWQV